MKIKAALNGGRREAHVPAMPEELAREAEAALEAGAFAVHVHPRGNDGRESLAADHVDAAVRALRAVCPRGTIGVTTGLWITGDARQRHVLIERWSELPDFASVNFDEDGSVDLAEMLHTRGIAIEAGLANERAASILVASGWSWRCVRILVEPQEQDAEAAWSNAQRIITIAGGAALLVHGADATSWEIARRALAHGHDTRIGFEDTLTLPDGTPATSNAEMIAALRSSR